MENLRLAVLGCSKLVYTMLMECLKPLPVEKVAVWGNDDDVAKLCRQYQCGTRYPDYRELLEKEHPEIVILFNNTGHLFEMARDCLSAGAYVFAERPVCGSIAEAEELIALQKKTGCYVVPRYNRRRAPSYLMAREIITRAEFGKTDMFIANYYAGPYASEHDMIWSHFSHMIDTLIFLCGKLELLHAEKIIKDEHRAGYNLSFASEKGAIGVMQSGFTQCYEFPMERVQVTGDRRCVVVENIRELTYYRPAPERKYNGRMVLEEGGDALCWKQNYGQMSLFSYYGFEGCLEEIVEAAAAHRPPAFHIEDALETIRILEDIEKKAVRI
jgi:predicted dehydrogenase